ncbi:RNA pseudouridine synthase [Bacterioplanes sanyensis]|uniref:RNA pseudouridine synthase n=1 Tax=Bacterioplanes sanyensis TaxID=1249553 RepID=A0A222FL43_9GAMM|nr:RluA family pseudouridine synthase [Bacterioplanes sanyensis]ASP39745.1 RNA pseudouridine synthase [Bacterioplanes sanyensis]
MHPPIEPLLIDEDILVVNKPSHLLSVPGRYEKDCLQARLESQFGTTLVVHRLDRDTSGVMVYARHKTALAAIQRQFERQTTTKEYEALVYGTPRGMQGCINLPIIVDWPNRPLQMISHTQGRYALTRWQRLETDGRLSRMRLLPQTGRSHQLRLHMQQIGCPIVGDTLYAGDQLNEEPRLMLHARRLEFDHPTQQQRLRFNCAPEF